MLKGPPYNELSGFHSAVWKCGSEEKYCCNGEEPSFMVGMELTFTNF